MESPYLIERTKGLLEEFGIETKNLSLAANVSKELADRLLVRYQKNNKFTAPNFKQTSFRERVSICYSFDNVGGFSRVGFDFYADDGDYSKITREHLYGQKKPDLEEGIVEALRECLPGHVIRVLPKSD